MKKLAYLVPVTLLFFIACRDQSDSKKQETDAAVEGFGHASMAVAATKDASNTPETERQETQKNVEDRLDQLSKRIKDLKAQASKAGEKAKAELNEMIKELDQKNGRSQTANREAQIREREGVGGSEIENNRRSG